MGCSFDEALRIDHAVRSGEEEKTCCRMQLGIISRDNKRRDLKIWSLLE
jgi:hypothetical protein